MSSAALVSHLPAADVDRGDLAQLDRDDAVLAAALRYAEWGVPVVPLHSVDASGACTCPKGAICRPKGKHPRISYWWAHATTNAEKIKGWFAMWPDANVGIPMGKPYRDTGLVLVTLDVDGETGEVSLRVLQLEYHALPETLTARTGSGGRHLLFLVAPADAARLKNDSGKARPGLDVRTVGGQIVAAPSIHASGRRYEWERVPESGPAEMPKWLLEVLVHDGGDTGRRQRAGVSAVAVSDDVDRDSFLMEECLPVTGGSRHQAGLGWAISMRDEGATYERTMELAPEFCDAASDAVDADHDFPLEELEEIVAGCYTMVEPASRIRAAALAKGWRGARFAVLDALLKMSIDACKPSFTGSFRTIAQRASCGERTAWSCANALEEDGWVARVGAGGMFGSTEWSFEDTLRSETHTRRVTEGATHTPHHLVSVSERDAFEHGALRACRPTLDLLIENPGSTLAELAQISPKAKSTVHGHLRLLERFELARERRGRWRDDLREIGRKLTRAADELNTSGNGEKRRRRHQLERDDRRGARKA